ncbi:MULTISPECIES: histidinol-phosphate transaminase [unclassified Clostridium]|uniref:histidinol-phosphate transaminase n=1 Tax=unclassified Clostridium TaxID=2614128 RepID=UPI000297BEE1|nr:MULTISPECIES: histidinol-phosphate transaminase [unclassified Clostridium]EKQ57419.1 MAG: histidinol-phosphate aminotransferase [Clostridium sp. Maddingley MBC34-26]
MSKYWSEITKNIEPYVPGEQPKDRKYIKLNTNENPYPPSSKVIEAIKQAAEENLQLYPDPNCDDLRSTVADYYNLSPNQIFVGNGSDEVLAFSFMAFFNRNNPILFPDITYSFYEVYVKLFNLKKVLIPVDDNFDFSVESFCTANGGVVIANPNAPTTKYLSVESLRKVIEYNLESVVIIDEAYVDFGGESMIKFINNYPNLLIIQTLSKSRALAGLRVGFAFGHKDLIEGLNRIKNSINSYTLDRLSLAGAKASFEDDAYFQSIGLKVIDTREKVIPNLKKLGFKVLESKANFLFVSHNTIEAKILFKELRNNGILVRYFNKPKIDNYLRISIGTQEEMEVLLEKLREIILFK